MFQLQKGAEDKQGTGREQWATPLSFIMLSHLNFYLKINGILQKKLTNRHKKQYEASEGGAEA